MAEQQSSAREPAPGHGLAWSSLRRAEIQLPASARPRLVVVVDTEAEFDWTAEPDSKATEVTAIQNIHRIQEIFDEYEITPCYVVDYPVATQAESVDILRSLLSDRLCEIGAHLHPWVNPPLGEDLSRSNMYPGNLGRKLERAKLELLTDTIEESFGIRPQVYKAGRYGIGSDTFDVLRSLGYKVDLSVCPPFDYSGDGGPDFCKAAATPFWFGDDLSMFELPLSGAFVGVSGALAGPLHHLAGKFELMRLRGILARLNIVDRLLLSPEGHSFDEHKKLVKFLLGRGVRTFTWSFHSPSVSPGMTIYTQNNRELKLFLDSFRRFFDYFLGELDGVATTPLRLRKELQAKVDS
jgi:hypothetical protein